MDSFARLRRARTRVVKVQRRIWLVQVAFWPVVTLGCVAIATAGAYLVRRRRHVAAQMNEGTAVYPEQTTKIYTPTNGTSSAR